VEELSGAGVYDEPIVTEIVPLDRFYPAEDYHQDFLARNPGHPYIVYWDLPKLEHLGRRYSELLAE